MHLIIILLVVLLIVGSFPRWGYSQGWGYGPSGIGGLLLILLVIWLFWGGGLRHF